MLEERWSKGTMLCVGLDSDINEIARNHRHYSTKTKLKRTVLLFNQSIVDATHDTVCAFKINIAFYIKLGAIGWPTLYATVAYIREVAPSVPVILDAKLGDVHSTCYAYAEAVFGQLAADAVTLNPYIGGEALLPFLEWKNKGVFILCRTSNYDSGEFQNLEVRYRDSIQQTDSWIPLYRYVANRVIKNWNGYGNCGLVVGATNPKELALVREMSDDMPILIPGIGVQGGNLRAVVEAGKNSSNKGMIISSSREIVKKDARTNVIRTRDEINRCL